MKKISNGSKNWNKLTNRDWNFFFYSFKSIKASRQNNNLLSMNNGTARKCALSNHIKLSGPFFYRFYFFSLYGLYSSRLLMVIYLTTTKKGSNRKKKIFWAIKFNHCKNFYFLRIFFLLLGENREWIKKRNSNNF
jgi:hypothetical protein